MSDQQQQGTKGKGGETAEERERRRQRLLAAGNDRLSKIVSSVGGTNLPPSNVASPANIVRSPEPAVSAKKAEKKAERGSELRGRLPKQQPVEPPSPMTSASAVAPVLSEPIEGPCGCDHRHTLMLMVVCVGAVVAARSFLGRECFAAAFSSFSGLSGGCAERFAAVRMVGATVLLAALLPPIIIHGRRGDYLSAVRGVATGACLSAFLIVLLVYLAVHFHL